MTASREIELKLELSEAGARALRTAGVLAGTAPSTARQTTIYYDTAKRALARRGMTLRLRRSGGRVIQTIKQARGDAAGLFARAEYEEDVAGPGLDFDAIDRTPIGSSIGAKRRGKLEPVVTSTVERSVWLLDHAGSALEVNLDEGIIVAGGTEQPLRELEIELKRGAPDAILDLARAIARDVDISIGVLTKAERGFALAAGTLGTVSKAEPILIGPGMTVAESFAAIVHACLKHFRLNEGLIVERRDAEALHQARVAMRRLRSALSLFAPAIADPEFARLREELRWFTGTLGDARNLDVLLQRFADEALPAEDEAALTASRDAAYAQVLAALGSGRARTLMLDLVGWIELGAWRTGDAATAPILSFALDRLERRWRKIKKAGPQLKTLDEEPRHRLRIEIKKLRYALEFLAGLFDPDSHKAFLHAMANMQEELGALNDFATARGLLSEIPGIAPERIPAPGRDAERKHLRKAQKAFANVRAVGPYWREAVASGATP
ncbi:CYTH and CHAD domain-containing protein [Allosphingosinicella deserti]|uniref:Inorganic triphosphatase n=1 Tax=Allosphingosinicella deserti TaxID=2116704 RepID=A0A2P7QM79_9SPHN|nr:CHAD domain-containing protein [Sphingomonas deserti]PSJ39066.1 inorganic triphosphatase [Sphingomonas deserti]